MPDAPVCRCGHPRDIHLHYRDGTDCGRCGRDVCPTYRRPHTKLADAANQRLHRLLALIRRRH